MPLTRSTKILATILGGGGVLHLVRPAMYEPLMPAWVPAHREVILGSGVVEIALAAGLLAPSTRRLAGWGSIGLLLGVYPANLKMAGDASRSRNTAFKAIAFGRLPLQAPLVKMAYDATR